MKRLKEFLNCGNLYKKRETFQLMVTKLEDIVTIIIPFFKKYPIRGVKAIDFANWCTVVELGSRPCCLGFKPKAAGGRVRPLCKNKVGCRPVFRDTRNTGGGGGGPPDSGVSETGGPPPPHLTAEGLEKIRKIKAGMNTRRK